MGGTTSKERRRIRGVLNRLLASIRGQLFLINLSRAMSVLNSTFVSEALATITASEMRLLTEAALLVHVKNRLQRHPGLFLANRRHSFSDFCSDAWVVNVMTEAVYNAHYRDPVVASSGHGFGRWTPGDLRDTYASGAATRDYFWIAPVESFPNSHSPRNDAESCRDRLGLVHIREKATLVALHLQLRSNVPPVYLPTVVEANPNARFRQFDPNAPTEDRWGKTIDLQLLAQDPLPPNIGGSPELVSGQLKLDDADKVLFYLLGPTKTDQSTTTSDQALLDHMLVGSSIKTIHATLCATLAP